MIDLAVSLIALAFGLGLTAGYCIRWIQEMGIHHG